MTFIGDIRTPAVLNSAMACVCMFVCAKVLSACGIKLSYR